MQARLTAGLQSRRTGEMFSRLYGGGDTSVLVAKERIMALYAEHVRKFGRKDDVRFFSAPGRTELAGNHTDHNLGKVLAAAVNLDTIMAASPNDTGVITLYSEGFSSRCVVDTAELGAAPAEYGADTALIRGVCAGMARDGRRIGGFDAVTTSNVLVGSGLSSSAAFEVLIATALDCLYNAGDMDGLKKAQIARYAENVHFGKPCGLMDQAASALGGLTALDFGTDTPSVENLEYDFSQNGLSLVVVNTGSSHDDLTEHYAAIPDEMRSVAAVFGRDALRGVSLDALTGGMADARQKAGDRAVLRAIHYLNENLRVDAMIAALKRRDICEYLRLTIESGDSSWRLLQNVYVGGQTRQPLALALAESARLLAGKGAWRVHGGGFAGTILAYVPRETMPAYIKAMNALFGPRSCTVLAIRPVGAAEIIIKQD